jgi:hypothetical protein
VPRVDTIVSIDQATGRIEAAAAAPAAAPVR